MNTLCLTRYSFFVFVCGIFFISGCVQKDGKYIQGGKEYGTIGEIFQESWFTNYARGKSFSEGNFHQEAIKHFKKAIKDHERDEWNETILEKGFAGYFPHRELGIVYFKRKEYALAISELEVSIQTAPSSKAYSFLNRARKEKIRLEESDAFPPEIHIKGIQGKRKTNDATHIIKGVALDDTFIASIQIGEHYIPIELAKHQQVFSKEIQLNEGENTVSIIATDISGKKTTHTLEIFSDSSSPIVEILQIEDKGDESIVRGVVSDQAGLQSLTINGMPWKISGAFSAYNFTFAVTDEKTVLVAKDKTGNSTKVALNNIKPERDPRKSSVDAPFETDSSLHPFVKDFFESHPSFRDPAELETTDSDPPNITIKGIRTNQVITYKERILLDYIIEDNSPLHSISIDGEFFPIKKGSKIYFSQLKKLDEGSNEFLLTAADIHGKTSEKKIVVERKIKNIHQMSSRMSVAVVLQGEEKDGSTAAKSIQTQLIHALHEQKRFNIVTPGVVESVRRGLKHSNSYLTRPHQITELGRVADAEAVLVITFIESGETLEIIARLIDTESRSILARNDVYVDDYNPQTLQHLLATLAFKLNSDVPVTEGMITEVLEGNEVVINIGLDKHIKPGIKLICFREGIDFKHPVTGEVLGSEPEIIASFTVKEVFENFSKASLEKKNKPVRIYDQIITR